jgi:16S rRNA C1402 (ribose-2'-O) methylase RsmI
LARELTKVYETILRGSARELLARIGPGDVKGEIAIAFEGYDAASSPRHTEDDDPLGSVWTGALGASAGDTRAALKVAAKALGIKKPELWRRLVERGLVRD